MARSREVGPGRRVKPSKMHHSKAFPGGGNQTMGWKDWRDRWRRFREKWSGKPWM